MVQKRNLFFIKPIFHPTVRTLIESDVTITKSIEDANDSLVWLVIPTFQLYISKEATTKMTILVQYKLLNCYKEAALK